MDVRRISSSLPKNHKHVYGGSSHEGSFVISPIHYWTPNEFNAIKSVPHGFAYISACLCSFNFQHAQLPRLVEFNLTVEYNSVLPFAGKKLRFSGSRFLYAC
jgi:hypothetical protein